MCDPATTLLTVACSTQSHATPYPTRPTPIRVQIPSVGSSLFSSIVSLREIRPTYSRDVSYRKRSRAIASHNRLFDSSRRADNNLCLSCMRSSFDKDLVSKITACCVHCQRLLHGSWSCELENPGVLRRLILNDSRFLPWLMLVSPSTVCRLMRSSLT